jgi:hypothetical protein
MTHHIDKSDVLKTCKNNLDKMILIQRCFRGYLVRRKVKLAKANKRKNIPELKKWLYFFDDQAFLMRIYYDRALQSLVVKATARGVIT